MYSAKKTKIRVLSWLLRELSGDAGSILDRFYTWLNIRLIKLRDGVDVTKL